MCIFLPQVENYKIVILTLPRYLLELLGTLLILELVIIRVCGFNQNIESEIKRRQEEEFKNRAEGLFPLNGTKSDDTIDSKISKFVLF